MAVVVSLINMKGGVGKTTIAAQLAHEAESWGWKVLAVDLDPQANLTQALLGQYRYLEHVQADRNTIDHVVRRYVPPSRRRPSPAVIDIRDAVLVGVGHRPQSSLDLLPSQLELAYTMKRSSIDPQALARGIARIADEYKLILIDCAPTESVLTEVAYHASRFLLVPVRPEYLATIGLPLLEQSLREFRHENRRHALDIAGIAINHASYPSQEGKEGLTSVKEVRQSASEYGWHIFNAQIPYSRSWPRAMRDGTPIGRTSHARGKVKSEFGQFAVEFFETVGLVRPSR